MKKDVLEQLVLLLKEYDVNYETFIHMVFDYFDTKDLKGLVKHVAEELGC